VTIAAITAMPTTAIAIAISIAADVPTAAPAVANKADLIGLDTADIDGAEVADRQSRGRSRKSNREGGRGKCKLDDVHEISLWEGKSQRTIKFQEKLCIAGIHGRDA
jgi:hypothetical protein